MYQKQNLKHQFIDFCKTHEYEINDNQINLVSYLNKFIQNKKNFIFSLFQSNEKLCFYLYGSVGVGKTMIVDFIFDSIITSKKRFHFNEFMVKFHNFRHNNKNNSISLFAKGLKKKAKLIYLDEFQVTNIVDAMILGKLFENLFKEKIKIIITSNVRLDNLYQDGLQREQFLPFISLIKSRSILKELVIEEDYRMIKSDKLQRVFCPANEKNNFKINQIFRELTKTKKLKIIEIKVKGRIFKIKNFFDGYTKFEFKDLCDKNVGAEDYIEIAKVCKFMVIQNIPNFNKNNSDQQQRFITLIDILYEKKISLMVSCLVPITEISSSDHLKDVFKRTLSRLYELTLPDLIDVN